MSAKWTLRKQAALVLDNLAVTFSAALVLPHALSAIQQKLQTGGSGPEVVCSAVLFFIVFFEEMKERSHILIDTI